MPSRTPRSRLAVGLMSGTSMDGIDAALVRISGPKEKPRLQLLKFISIPYPTWLQTKLLAIARGISTTANEISQLNVILGELFGIAAARVCHERRVSPSRLFIVGSHGQTIFHFGGTRGSQGRVGGRRAILVHEAKAEDALDEDSACGIAFMGKPSTLQIADPAAIAEAVRAPVVADFRVADMAAGGQGAPLVPMVDYLLLRDAREGRVALNIGGIANVTVLPARARPDQVFGFDTGPGNMVMDALVRRFTNGREQYDAAGRVAERGKVDELLLDEILKDPFFEREPPKSAGREQFGEAFVDTHFLSRRRMRFNDAVCTAAELTARTVAGALERFIFPKAKVHRLIVSGGGAHNRFLLGRLKELLPRVSLALSDDFGLPVDAKEAMAFALLADRTMHGLPGNLPAVTGARRAVVLGKISRP